ncbi:MAG TPA: hemerythrin domain-containing protein [Bryobacteraceae bacterium]|nr:hemerythrin domain-containing protein [Bryobacteraceae bacterium]
MSTPIEQLQAEHRIIAKALRALTGLSARLEQGERVDPAAFQRMFEFLTVFADQRHHQKEEKCLFPALGRQGLPRDHGPVGMMLQEHCTGRALISHMKRAASGYVNGDPNAPHHFAEAAADYVHLLSEHIAKEDNMLFRIAENVLDGQAMQSLQNEFDQAEAELPGSYAKYAHEAEELEHAWALQARTTTYP